MLKIYDYVQYHDNQFSKKGLSILLFPVTWIFFFLHETEIWTQKYCFCTIKLYITSTFMIMLFLFYNNGIVSFKLTRSYQKVKANVCSFLQLGIPIELIKNLKSRFIVIHKNSFQYFYLHENIFIVSGEIILIRDTSFQKLIVKLFMSCSIYQVMPIFGVRFH